MTIQRPSLTLHQAMALVLRDCTDRTVDQVFLAAEINRRRLYWQKNGNPLRLSQIGPRAKNYPHLFEKLAADPASGTMAKIRLRAGTR